MIDSYSDLTGEYLAESLDHLATVETELLALEAGGLGADAEGLHRIFRAIYTIKGGAGMLELGKIGELAHQMESVLAVIRSGNVAPAPDRVRVLLQATDRIRELIQDPGTSDQADTSDLMAALVTLCEDRLPGAGTATGQAPAAGTLRALLVEDDFSSRLVLQTFLSRYGECHVAVNGREAVQAARSALERGQRYDLICMDIMMPEMNGREAVRQIRTLEVEHGILSTYGAKIVMTTAVDDIKEVIRCFQELCDGYLVKPIDLNLLLNQMKSYQLLR
jgi:two-component system chemotaxis response regulator CheY